MSQPVVVFDSEEAWIEGVTERIISCLRAALAARRRATLLLSGGGTPAPIYRELAKAERIPWEQVHLFWGDERWVPPDDPESNFRLVNETLLVPLGLAPDAPTVHRFPTSLTPAEDAAMYEQNLRLFFGLASGEVPLFDLVLLGMGEDGHTASLFPDSVALQERERLAVANPLPTQGTVRLTVTFPVLNAARHRFVLVRGASKAPIVAAVLVDGEARYPIQHLNPQETTWFLDQEAAGAFPTN